MLTLILIVFATCTHASPLNERVDQLFSAYNKPNVPGASVIILRDHEIAYEKAYGMANLEDSEAATVHTNYRLASVTKQMTAFAIMILKERGLLNYEQNLREFFPEFPSYANSIRIRHLLHHQSGLVDYEDILPGDRTEQLSDRDVLDLLVKQASPYFTAGSQYRYSNGAYVLLGLIVEEVSGQSFASFLKENVFAPLGMVHTVAFENGISTVDFRSFGYSGSEPNFYRTDQNVTSATLGDGGVYSSVHELRLWDEAMYGNLLVSSHTLEEAFKAGKLNSGEATNYGFGWMLGNYRGRLRQYHTGSSIGFRSAIIRFPHDGLTVIVLINRANVSPLNLAEATADLYLD